MDDFSLSAVVAASVAIAVYLSFSGTSPLFALFLFALGMAGYFCLEQLHEAGLKWRDAFLVLLAACAFAYAASAVSFGAFSAMVSLAFVPFALAAPAIAKEARAALISG
jgi:hypothetical protein